MVNRIFNRILNGQSKTITSAAIMLAAAGLASRFLGMIRQRLLVGTFGAGNTLDAYFAAFQIPDLAFNILILATLSVAFIPVFCHYLERNKDEAWHIASAILNLTMIMMGTFCLIFFIFAPQFVHLISPGFSGQKFLLTVGLTRVLMLSPWLFAISSVFGSILNAFKNFTAVAIAPLFYNLGIIFGIIFLAPAWGIYGVAVGVIFGALLHILIQLPGARRLGFKWQAVLGLKHKGVREILKLIVPRLLTIDISQASQLIGTIIGSLLITGSVAIFSLVYNIEAVPVGVFAISFVVSVFPNLSEAVVKNDRQAFRNNFSYVARQILFFLIPLTILTFIFRAQVVRLIIGTQKLSWDETRLSAAVLAIFGFAFIFQGLSLLLSRAFFALKNTVIPLMSTLIAIGINIGVTLYFSYILQRNGFFVHSIISFLRLEGLTDIRILALPTGFFAASVINVIILFTALRKSFGRLDGRKIWMTFLKYLVAGLGAGAAGYSVLFLVEPLTGTNTVLGLLAQLIIATLAASIIFTIISLVMKSEEMMNLISSAKGRLFKSVEYLDVGETEEL